MRRCGTPKTTVSNADAYAMLEILHVVRDNLNFDLRDTFPAWFKQYPLLHLMAHYPAPWPGSENEFRIPADETIEKRGPDVRKAALSRAAELAMVAYDANAASSQLLQGWVTNDRFLMRGAFGIPYEFLWANPYQPGLSYYHVPLALHDEIGGQLFVRSSWEDDAEWLGFFGGQLQLFRDGGGDSSGSGNGAGASGYRCRDRIFRAGNRRRFLFAARRTTRRVPGGPRSEALVSRRDGR